MDSDKGKMKKPQKGPFTDVPVQTLKSILVPLNNGKMKMRVYLHKKSIENLVVHSKSSNVRNYRMSNVFIMSGHLFASHHKKTGFLK